MIYHGPDTRYTGQEICLVFTGDYIRILDVTNKCDIRSLSFSGYSFKSFVHQGWWSDDHSYFVMGDENDEVDSHINTRSILWDASVLTSLRMFHDFRSSTGAVGVWMFVHIFDYEFRQLVLCFYYARP